MQLFAARVPSGPQYGVMLTTAAPTLNRPLLAFATTFCGGDGSALTMAATAIPASVRPNLAQPFNPLSPRCLERSRTSMLARPLHRVQTILPSGPLPKRGLEK